MAAEEAVGSPNDALWGSGLHKTTTLLSQAMRIYCSYMRDFNNRDNLSLWNAKERGVTTLKGSAENARRRLDLPHALCPRTPTPVMSYHGI